MSKIDNGYIMLVSDVVFNNGAVSQTSNSVDGTNVHFVMHFLSSAGLYDLTIDGAKDELYPRK